MFIINSINAVVVKLVKCLFLLSLPDSILVNKDFQISTSKFILFESYHPNTDRHTHTADGLHHLDHQVVADNDDIRCFCTLQSTGSDPVEVRGFGPHKNLLVEYSMTRTPTKILLKEI